jgi:hypothetical protein
MAKRRHKFSPCFKLETVLDAVSRAVRGWQVSEYLTFEALTLPALHWKSSI